MLKTLSQLIIKLLGKANARELTEWLYFKLENEEIPTLESYKEDYLRKSWLC